MQRFLHKFNIEISTFNKNPWYSNENCHQKCFIFHLWIASISNVSNRGFFMKITFIILKTTIENKKGNIYYVFCYVILIFWILTLKNAVGLLSCNVTSMEMTNVHETKVCFVLKIKLEMFADIFWIKFFISQGYYNSCTLVRSFIVTPAKV